MNKLKTALFSLFAFVFLLSLNVNPASAVVSPGQEQERFQQDTQSKFSRHFSEDEDESSVAFGKDSSGYSDEETSPTRYADDEEGDRQSGSRRLVLPIQGKISLEQLKALADSIKDIEQEDGEVEVFLSIEIGKKGVSGKRSISHASEQFDKPLPPAGYDPKEASDLREADRYAQHQMDRQAASEAAAATNVAPFREDVPFFVEKINVTGNTALTNEDIRLITTPYEGKELKLADAKAIAENITQAYRTKGFITSRAYIPPQNIQTKTLEIKVFEGKLGKVKVRGNKYFKKRIIRRYVQQLQDKALMFKDLKSGLTKLNMHPDREVKAVIVPGQDVGTSDLLLDVRDTRPIHVGAEINNFGTKLTGRQR